MKGEPLLNENTRACKNCETLFEGKYCPNCGQSVFEYERPFRFLIADFTGNIFAFDTRFWSSLKALTLKPGRLSKDFIQGKRARYMPPFRFFIFTSFLFFLVFSSYLGKAVVVSDKDKQEVYKALQQTDSTAVKTQTKTVLDSLEGNELFTTKTDSTQNALNNLTINFSADKDNTDIDEVERLKKAVRTVIENPKIYMNSFLKFLSWSLFLLLPVYALILWLFFRKTTPYYYSHLILAVNQHSFWFLILTVVFTFQYLLPERDFELELYLLYLLPLHTFLGYKQLYNRGWLRSLSKSLGIAITYSISLLFAMGAIFTLWVKSEFL